MTVRDYYINAKNLLQKSGIEDFAYDARLILENILSIGHNEWLISLNKNIPSEKLALLDEKLEKRQNRYPLQYILGEWNFYKYSFKVGEGVLIPRSDTEILVEKCCEYLKTVKQPKVLDLCAGSGCIGISIAKDFPQSAVFAVEKFDSALEYLNRNIEHNNATNVTVIKGDVLAGDGSDGVYNLIVSNPPYIPPCEMEIISPETRFEPKTALLGGQDGMLFYKAIVKEYKNSLTKGGMLAFEVGINEDRKVAEILKTADFKNITVTKDFNGINRVVTAIK
ncbi:MAG: peptide chain release factor N(5)-glutamine methyltransferase [Acutalibacteraceae bacterium]|jgi:release factor glutamine methyltransferase|nr:peptide chain release factor N(5)-glutamine methyltransferase [Acutalibacteraceae bacterium]